MKGDYATCKKLNLVCEIRAGIVQKLYISPTETDADTDRDTDAHALAWIRVI